MAADGWKEWPDDVADEVRRELFAATALDDRDGLDRLGLLVTPVLPPRVVAPAPDPLLDQIEGGLTALAGTEKSALWPGERPPEVTTVEG